MSVASVDPCVGVEPMTIVLPTDNMSNLFHLGSGARISLLSCVFLFFFNPFKFFPNFMSVNK